MSDKSKPYPFKSIPLYKNKIWGGRKIAEKFGKILPVDEKIGESWEAADLKEGASLIDSGEFKEMSLTEAVAKWGAELIGEKWDSFEQFPLLVKIIDANDDLSVQVHPDSDSCMQYFPQHHSKDETWFVLGAGSDKKNTFGSIYWGFKKGAQLSDYLDAVRQNTVTQILREVTLREGDAIRIPPGCVHAILKNMMILEIQEPSDSTFRIYDYGRLGDNGKPRAIHLDEAAKVMKFDYVENPILYPETKIKPWGIQHVIVDTPSYRIEKWNFDKHIILGGNSGTVRVLFNLGEEVYFENSTNSFTAYKGETIIIPACVENIKIHAGKNSMLIASGAYQTDLTV